MGDTTPRYTARRFPGPPDPYPWGIWDSCTEGFVAFEGYSSQTAAAAVAEKLNLAHERARAA